ncbi:MAG: nucleotide exchange factor GrpE [Chloroflexi bacterium]|nr:nucleotide exchange factor GrpE [Chloroflexota bacterium]
MTDKKSKAKEPENSVEIEVDLAAELESLKTQLTESQAKVQEYLDGLQRERADFTNYRRRMEQENSQMGRIATGTTIKKFIIVMDDLERALAHRPADDVWASGIDLVYRKFQSLLEAEGVTRMEVEGRPFDPNLHEAIMQEPSETHESGTVISVLQQGYMHGERVLRPALVKVAQ